MRSLAVLRGSAFLFALILIVAGAARAQLVANAGLSSITVKYEEDDYINGLGAVDRNFSPNDVNGPPWAPGVFFNFNGGPSAGAGSSGQGAAIWGVVGGAESLTMPLFTTGINQAPVPPGGAAAGAQARMLIATHNVYDVPGGGVAVPAHAMVLNWFFVTNVAAQPVGTPPAGVGQEHAAFSAQVTYKINGAAADLQPGLGGVQDVSSISASTPLGVPGFFFQQLVQTYTTPLLNPGDQLSIDSEIIFEGDPASITLVPEPAAGLLMVVSLLLGRRARRTA